jgi:hypothetical protein
MGRLTTASVVVLASACAMSACGGSTKSKPPQSPAAVDMTSTEARHLWTTDEGDALDRGARRHRVANAINARHLLAADTIAAMKDLLGRPDDVAQRGTSVIYGYRVGVYRRGTGGCTEVLDMTFARRGPGRAHLRAWCVADAEILP